MIRSLAASALAFVSLAGTAQAETVRVSYADLNLSSHAGLRSLHLRVDRAIDEVCGAADPDAMWENPDLRNCRTNAEKSSTQQIASAVNGRQRQALRGTGMQIASR